jgi:excisionase family DNA binding protein
VGKAEETTTTPLSVRDHIAKHHRAMTANELAEILNVSPITIYKQAKAGLIPSFRVGTAVRFSPREVADWIANQVVS